MNNLFFVKKRFCVVLFFVATFVSSVFLSINSANAWCSGGYQDIGWCTGGYTKRFFYDGSQKCIGDPCNNCDYPACGSANGGTYSSAPSPSTPNYAATWGPTPLCSGWRNGASSVWLDGNTWRWTCQASALSLNNVSCWASKPPPPVVIPSCSIGFSPSSLMIGNTGSVTLSLNNDADGQASCSCTGLDSPAGPFALGGGTYPQSFSFAGTKSCTCTVVSWTGHSNSCSGSISSYAPIIPSCSVFFSPKPMYYGYSGSLSVSVSNDSDGVANCSCSGLGAGVYNYSSGTYPQSFVSAGTKSCTCSVTSSTGHSSNCSDSVNVNAPCSYTTYNFTGQPCNNGTVFGIPVVNTLPQATCPGNGIATMPCGWCNPSSSSTVYPNISAISGVSACSYGNPVSKAYSALDARWTWTCTYNNGMPDQNCTGLNSFIDIGLRIKDDSVAGGVIIVGVEEQTNYSPLKIWKNRTWSIGLVPVGSSNGSKARIQTSSGVRAIVGAQPNCCSFGTSIFPCALCP